MALTIYYVDDDPDDLFFFEIAVRTINKEIKLLTFERADQFLNALHAEENKELLIFLDINIPVKNGYFLLKEIRASKKLKHLPVIMFSTSESPESINISKEFGASRYVVKPPDVDRLVTLLRELIQMKWVTEVAPEKNFVLQ